MAALVSSHLIAWKEFIQFAAPQMSNETNKPRAYRHCSYVRGGRGVTFASGVYALRKSTRHSSKRGAEDKVKFGSFETLSL